MKLSICICAVPSRFFDAGHLFRKLNEQVGDKPVEVLMLLDNKKRTVGEKRQALLDLARGEYISFVDDDDDVSGDYIAAIYDAIEEDEEDGDAPDVVTFQTACVLEDGGNITRGVVEQRLGNPEEEFDPARLTKRRPTQIAAWSMDIARRVRFPALQWGEDRAWGDGCCALANKEAHIPRPLYTYRWSSSKTEAR